MGRDVPGPGHHRKHAQPVHDRLSADDRDPATARIVELHDHPERGRLQRPARRPYRAVSRDRHCLGARPRQPVPPCLGCRRQLVRQPAGVVRALLRLGPVDTRSRSGCDVPQERGDGARSRLPETRRHGGYAMSYRPKHLGHVNLYVRNAERSRQWYEDVLGLHTYHFRPGRAAFMSADKDKSHEVALMEVGDDAPLQAKRQVGLNHLAFMMESLDDLKDAYYRLKEKGVKFDHISDHGLSLGIYFRDPDGNGLEVSYELPREKWPRQDSVFAPEVVNLGLFPGPWEEEMQKQRAAAPAQ